MLKIAHIVNTFQARAGTEWEWVQPVTFESMRRAQTRAEKAGCCSVELFSAHFAQDAPALPEGFRSTAVLERSVRDIPGFESKPPLPFIGDILQRGFDATDADYLIYTNIDIAVQPHFYEAVARFVEAGLDGFIINRRRIPGHYRHVAELGQMYAEKGKSHPGFDCFVFRREMFPQFRFAEVIVGIPFIGILTAQNLFAFSQNFRLFEDEYLTFHIGEDVFKDRDKDLMQYNRREFRKAIQELDPWLDSSKFPYGEEMLLKRMIKWGLHPSIPIKLAMKLEWRRILGNKRKGDRK